MIRRALAEDNDALCELLLRCPQSGGSASLATDRSPDYYRRSSPYRESWVLAVDGSGASVDATVTVAMKHVLVAGRRSVAGYVFDLAVRPEARGCGLAGRLLRQADELASSAGADFLYAHVMSGNEASLSTFARAGYEQHAGVVASIFAADPEPELEPEVMPSGAQHDWEEAAELVVGAESGFDLGKGLDAESLRDQWTRLPGWNPDDVWQEGGALLGLWDYSAVARYVPIDAADAAAADAAGAEASAAGLRAGLLLGGVGEEAVLSRLFAQALARAAARGMHAVFMGYDDRAEPAWFGDRAAVAEPYRLLAKVLRTGRAERLGERPVRVDPIDL
ncbi:MAG: GNAT family N-acetyltransferase [Acidimicrobiia bacterium]|nr:GNAT family N-acetyltransferase [Acidimicrobiia bacterium]